jgi:hypothetical protein
VHAQRTSISSAPARFCSSIFPLFAEAGARLIFPALEIFLRRFVASFSGSIFGLTPRLRSAWSKNHVFLCETQGSPTPFILRLRLILLHRIRSGSSVFFIFRSRVCPLFAFLHLTELGPQSMPPRLIQGRPRYLLLKGSFPACEISCPLNFSCAAHLILQCGQCLSRVRFPGVFGSCSIVFTLGLSCLVVAVVR